MSEAEGPRLAQHGTYLWQERKEEKSQDLGTKAPKPAL